MALMKMKRNLLGILSFQEKSKAKSILQYKSFIQDSKRRDKNNQGVVDRVLAEALIKEFQEDDSQIVACKVIFDEYRGSGKLQIYVSIA